MELKLVEVDLDGNNPVWQEGPNVQLDVRFGVANPRLQLSMGSFEMFNGPNSIYSEENIQSVRPLCPHIAMPGGAVCECRCRGWCASFVAGLTECEGAGCSERDAAAVDGHR